MALVLVLKLRETDETWLPTWQQALDQPDIERADSFRNRTDRTRHVAAHALLRTALASLTGIPAPSVPIARGPHGKPFLPSAPERHFSLTHTGGLVALALHDRPVGCDAERLDRRVHKSTFAVLATEEQEWLLGLPTQEERSRGFVRLWTAKESFAKAVGLGLSLPLRSFAFDMATGGPRLRRAPEACLAETTWSFGQFPIDPLHIIAVSAVGDGVPFRVRLLQSCEIARAAANGPPLAIDQ